MNSQRKYRFTGPVRRADRKKFNPIFAGVPDASGQYMDQDDPGVKCYHLMRVGHPRPVGFLWLVLKFYRQRKEIRVHVSYIFALPSERSGRLANGVFNKFRNWVCTPPLAQDSGITVTHSSSAISSGGHRFVWRLDQLLREWCAAHGAELRGDRDEEEDDNR